MYTEVLSTVCCSWTAVTRHMNTQVKPYTCTAILPIPSSKLDSCHTSREYKGNNTHLYSSLVHPLVQLGSSHTAREYTGNNIHVYSSPVHPLLQLHSCHTPREYTGDNINVSSCLVFPLVQLGSCHTSREYKGNNRHVYSSPVHLLSDGQLSWAAVTQHAEHVKPVNNRVNLNHQYNLPRLTYYRNLVIIII